MSRRDRAGHRASHVPFFLAATLARYQQHHGLSDEQLAALLRCSLDSLTHLRLYRLPATDQELAHIAHRFHVDQAPLRAPFRGREHTLNTHKGQYFQLKRNEDVTFGVFELTLTR